MVEPYLRTLEIRDAYAVQDVRIEFPPADDGAFRHLILTGRNGSGKSAVLRGLEEWATNSNFAIHHPDIVEDKARVFSGYFRLASDDPRRFRTDFNDVARELLASRNPILTFSARRAVSFNTPTGPTKDVVPQGTHQIEQLLINWRTQAAYALEADDARRAEQFRAQLRAFEANFADLMAPVPVTIELDVEQLRYRLRTEGRALDFENLPDGAKAALQLWVDTWTALETAKARGKVGGYILIDEPETHLHLGLQERILPFLARSFPTVQIIAATHSPAVAASLEPALIYDLTKRRGWTSESLHPWRYGRVMTEVFGLDDEYSDATSRDLKRLEHLASLAAPSADEDAELRLLADRLRDSSHTLALEVWLRLNHPSALAAR